MAKSKNNKKKNVKKELNKKIDKIESGVEKDWFKILCIVSGVLLFLAVFYLITVAIVSDDTDKDTEETTIQYDKILAGSSFNMKNTEYLVVYYDTTDTELSELTSAVYNYNYLYGALYTVDMSDGFNKKYATEEESNTSPEKAADLAINGPTLIRIVDGSCVEYIEGTDSIVSYLS